MAQESLHCPYCYEEIGPELIAVLMEDEYDGIECPHCREEVLVEKFVRWRDLPGIIRRGKARARMDFHPAEDFTKKQHALFRVRHLSKRLEKMRQGGVDKEKIKKALAMRRHAAKEHRELAQIVKNAPARVSKWKELKGIAKEYKRAAKPEIAKRYTVARSAGQSRREFLKSEMRRLLDKFKTPASASRQITQARAVDKGTSSKRRRKQGEVEVVGFSRGPRPKGSAKPFARAGFIQNESLRARVERILNEYVDPNKIVRSQGEKKSYGFSFGFDTTPDKKKGEKIFSFKVDRGTEVKK